MSDYNEFDANSEVRMSPREQGYPDPAVPSRPFPGASLYGKSKAASRPAVPQLRQDSVRDARLPLSENQMAQEICDATEQYLAMRQKNSPVWLPYVAGALITGFAILVGYQQVQINGLNQQLSQINDNVKGTDLRNQIEAHGSKLEALDARMTYMDSKLAAVTQMAQASQEKWHEQESKGNIFQQAVKNIGHTLGLN